MIDVNAGLLSAIAASCSAISSFTLMLIHRRNLMEASRPELIFFEWDRKKKIIGNNEYDTIIITRIKNVGKGTAYNIFINGDIDLNKRPICTINSRHIGIIPAGEIFDLNEEMVIYWGNVESSVGSKIFPLKINTICWDGRNYRHEFDYTFIVSDMKGIFCGGNEMAKGVYYHERKHRSRPVWLLKIVSRFESNLYNSRNNNIMGA